MDVPGYKNHIEYNDNGTPYTSQKSQKVIDYESQSRMYYLYRPGASSGVNIQYDATTGVMRNMDQVQDRAPFVSNLPGYNSFTTASVNFFNNNEGTGSDETRTVKNYDQKVQPPTEEGATVLLVQIKESWQNQYLGNYLQKAEIR